MSSSDPQFKVKSFPRGVKLARQYVWEPAFALQAALEAAQVQGQLTMAPFTMSWTWTPDSETYGSNRYDFDANGVAWRAPNQYAQVPLPMIFPPPQPQFDAVTKRYTSAPRLTELSLSMDQRANPYGITDQWTVWPPADPPRPTAPMPGMLANVDLSRYDTRLTLIQKVPTCFGVGGNDTDYQEVLTLDLPGSALFGAAALNPYVIDGLSQFLNPYGVYYWLVSTPGLAGLASPTTKQESALIVTGTPAGGTYQQYDCRLHLVIGVTAGDTFTLGTTGGGPYVFVASLTDGQQDIVNGLLALAAGDTLWDFTDGGNFNGALVPPGTGHIIATHKAVGPTAAAVTTALSNVADGTFTSTAGPAGTAANTLKVTDGPHAYTYVIQTGDTLAQATAQLAAAINNHDGYTATADGDVITVANAAGVQFVFTDASSNAKPGSTHCYIFFEIAYPLLAMPNLTLVCTFDTPLEPRDYCAGTPGSVPDPVTSRPYVQNIPVKHLGQPRTGTMLLPTEPLADTLITGDDVQSLVTTLEQPALDQLRAGYGRDPGNEADAFPWEQLANDAAYQVINVQMFPNWWDVRSESINPTADLPNGVGFPYLTPDIGAIPFTDPVVDQRIIRVPVGFVVHHVIVAQNTFPYGDNLVFPQAASGIGEWGSFDSAAILQKVGVAMYSGLRADDQQFQQVAYLEWTGASVASGADRKYLIDQLKLDQVHTNYVLLNAPLVWPTNFNGGASYGGVPVGTGFPVWLGAGNSTTAARSQCGQMPHNFGAGATQAPPTAGGENLLLVRWSIESTAVGGLGAAGTQVLTGPAGHQVIIIGKQSTVGSDTSGQVVSANPVVGVW